MEKNPTTNNQNPQYAITERLKAIIVLFRPHQYYKNFLVFFGLFFSKNLFRVDLWFPMVIAFVILCLVSSLNYIINDFRDIEKDRHHPEKSNRPFPSGKISSIEAILLMAVLVVITLGLVYLIPMTSTQINLLTPNPIEGDNFQEAQIIPESKEAFFLVILGLFVTSQLYSLLLKEKVFADVVTISVNYVWRAIAGAVLITVSVSPWLIILCFITAMMLSLAKRKGDLALLGTEAEKHKSVFTSYTPELLNQSLSTITAIEILAIFIYLIERHPKETVFIVVALPLITFLFFRFLYLTSRNTVASRKAERLFLDRQLLITGIIIGILFLIAIYYPNMLDNLLGIPDPVV
ncbi:MAG: UbiA prenyltransferase family protein [Candidatus Hodarchaeales archaeon]